MTDRNELITDIAKLNYAYAEEREKMFYLAVGVSAILLVLLLFLGWFYFFG